MISRKIILLSILTQTWIILYVFFFHFLCLHLCLMVLTQTAILFCLWGFFLLGFFFFWKVSAQKEILTLNFFPLFSLRMIIASNKKSRERNTSNFTKNKSFKKENLTFLFCLQSNTAGALKICFDLSSQRNLAAGALVGNNKKRALAPAFLFILISVWRNFRKSFRSERNFDS